MYSIRNNNTKQNTANISSCHLKVLTADKAINPILRVTEVVQVTASRRAVVVVATRRRNMVVDTVAAAAAQHRIRHPLHQPDPMVVVITEARHRIRRKSVVDMRYEYCTQRERG